MSWSDSLPIIIGFSVLLVAAAVAAIFPVTNDSTSNPVGQEQLQPAFASATRESGGGGVDTTRNGPEEQEPQQRTSPGSRAGPDESEEPQRTSPGARQTEQESLQRPGEGQQQEQESPCPEGTVLSGKGIEGECVSPDFEGESSFPKAAPIAISGNNVYIAWPTNNIGNDEVMLRGSNDGGATFADKINLSNTTDAYSKDIEIAADVDEVIVSWWERNATSDEPVLRASVDNGLTFGPLLRLATNGTIGQDE